MNASYIKIAIVLVVLSVSLKCGASDEAPTNQNGSPALASLSSPSDLHGPVIDGKEKFSELFHLDDGYKISYKETFDHPPHPALADALDRQWMDVIDPPGINRKASLEVYSKRLRKGSQDVFLYTFYVSKTSRLMVEKVEDDPWNKGYVIETYFTDKNITEVEPSADIATIFPPDASRYLELVIDFPRLYCALGYVPDRVQMITGKTPMFVIGEKDLPVSLLLKLDSNQSVIETDEVAFPNKNLSVAKFEYSTKSHLWPSRISTVVTAYNGTSEGHGTWDLLRVEKLPNGFDFRPKIEANYRIVDKTASKTLNQ